MKIARKSSLIEILSGAQVVCLTVALLGFACWIRSSVQSIVRRQMIGDNKLIAAQMGKLIEQTGPGSAEFGSRNWDRLQSMIEDVELPNDGYMCITDATTGNLLCHPEIRSNPKLRELKVGLASLRVGDKDVVIRDAASQHQTVTGTMGSGQATQIVSARHLKTANAVLLVHQREHAAQQAVNGILAPIGIIGMVVGCGLILVTKKTSVAILDRYESTIAEINAGLEETVRQRTRALTRTRDAVIFGLARLSESRDNDTGQHLDRIRTYVTILARQLAKEIPEVDTEFIEHIGLASSLHDIGKVGVPDAVLLKPGRLDQNERREIEEHPVLGQRCLEDIESQLGEDNFLSMAREICAHHHEKWDGSGYPSGLRGNAIPLSARIVALADVYDALRSRRPYKEPFSHQQAREIIVDGSGTHFDPSVVAAFLNTEQQFIKFSNDATLAEIDSQIDTEPATETPAERKSHEISV